MAAKSPDSQMLRIAPMKVKRRLLTSVFAGTAKRRHLSRASPRNAAPPKLTLEACAESGFFERMRQAKTELGVSTNGAGTTSWVTQGLAHSGEQSANFTTQLNVLNLVDTTARLATVTAPPRPVPGDRFWVSDSRANAAMSNITVDFVTAGDNFHAASASYTFAYRPRSRRSRVRGRNSVWVIAPQRFVPPSIDQKPPA